MWFSRFYIGGNDIEWRAVLFKRRIIEWNEIFWDIAVAEIVVDEIARRHPRFHAHETRVAAKGQVESDTATVLPGQKRGAVNCTGRYACHAVEPDAMLTENIENARRIYSAHSAAF